MLWGLSWPYSPFPPPDREYCEHDMSRLVTQHQRVCSLGCVPGHTTLQTLYQPMDTCHVINCITQLGIRLLNHMWLADTLNTYLAVKSDVVISGRCMQCSLERCPPLHMTTCVV